jgi:hypothetical protein
LDVLFSGIALGTGSTRLAFASPHQPLAHGASGTFEVLNSGTQHFEAPATIKLPQALDHSHHTHTFGPLFRSIFREYRNTKALHHDWRQRSSVMTTGGGGSPWMMHAKPRRKKKKEAVE